MKRFYRARSLAMLLFLLVSAAMTWASPDPRLLSLVPPGTQIVAGVSNPMLHGRTDGFLLTPVSSTTAAIARKATLGWSKVLPKVLRCITSSPECLSSFEMMASICL
jgi:hypothetical protein